MANEVIVDLTFRIKNAEKKLKQIEAKAKKAGDKAGDNLNDGFSKKVSTGLGSITKQVVALGIGFKALGVAMRFAGESFDDFRKFGRGLAEINTLLPQTEKLTQRTVTALSQFSEQYGSTAQKQARAYYNIVSAGVKGTAKQLQTLETANKAAVAGLVDIDSSAKVLVSSVNAYVKSGLTAERASDILFATVREGQTTFGELSETLGNTTSIAANAGAKYSELAGALAFVTKSGIKTDIAVTGLRQIFATVIGPTKEARDEAHRLGIEFSTAGLKAKGFAGFLKDLQKRTGGNETSLKALFGNIRALTPILNIVNGNFKDFERILEETENSAGDTAKAFAIMEESMDFQLSGLSAQLDTIGRGLVGKLAPALDIIISKSRTVAGFLAEAFTPPSRIDEINEQTLNIADSIADLKGKIKDLQDGGIAQGVANLFDPYTVEQRVQIYQEKIAEMITSHKDFQAEKRAILEKEKGMTAEEIELARQKAQKIAAFNQQLATKLGMIGLTSLQKLEARYTAEKSILDQSLESKIISEGEYYSRLAVIQGTFATKEQAINDQRTMSAEATTAGIGAAFDVLAKKAKITSGKIASITNNVLAKGLGNSFSAVGKAMAEGGNAMEAFSEGIKSTFGDLASSLGDYYIQTGVARMAASYGADGGAVVAAGAALKILGGFLGGGGGSSSASGGGAGGGSTSGYGDSEVLEPQELERQTSSTINISVEGSLVQQEELGLFIQDTLNEVNEKNGIIQVNTRTA